MAPPVARFAIEHPLNGTPENSLVTPDCPVWVERVDGRGAVSEGVFVSGSVGDGDDAHRLVLARPNGSVPVDDLVADSEGACLF